MSSTTPDRWREIEAVLEAVLQADLELPPHERDALLDRMCGEDVALRSEVASLLAAHDAVARDASRAFLADSAETFAEPILRASAARESNDRAGLLIGRYRLIEQIGSGGFGSVWLAERADGQFAQRVALKLIKRGMDTDDIVARFLQERQILARLEHPNIARLLDGGVGDDDRPYFVMEYVAGQPLTDYCDSHALPIADRLRLFVVAARAVGFAHRNLIVHRDLKPSNVLVDEQGQLKLLDFGIAKLLGSEPDVEGVHTAGADRLMTPEYASPEQQTYRPVTTASDVYQLGVLLHELLAGERPAGGHQKAEPGSPFSLSVSVSRSIRGDLATILMRALREEPDSRYPSVEALADDVERHLAHQPILYGGDRTAYRAGKFVRRHRVGIVLSVAFVVVAIGAAAFDAVRVRRERDRARHEVDKAAEVTQLMARFLQGWSPDASDRGEVSTRKLLGDAALRAERELQGRPEMLGAMLSIIGDFHTTVGEWEAADSLLLRARAIQLRLQPSPGADLAATESRLARLLLQSGRAADAAVTMRHALDLHRKVYGARHFETLRIQRDLAKALAVTKRYAEAELLMREILTSLDGGASNPSPFALEVSSDLGNVVFQQARYDEAVAILRPTLARQRELFGDVHVSTINTIRSLASTLRDRGELDESLLLYREALRIARALYGGEHPETQVAIFTLALALTRTGQLEEAEQLARDDLSLGERIYGRRDTYRWYRLAYLGAIRLDRGDAEGAEALLRQSLALARTNAPADDPDLADVLNRLAFVSLERNRRDAEAVYREAVAFDEARPRDRADFVTDGLHFLAMAEQQHGDLAAAEEDFQRSVRAYERLPQQHPYLVAATTGLKAVQELLRHPGVASR